MSLLAPTVHRVGIIGTGGIARTHLLGYQHAGVDIVALCDSNADVLERRQAEWSIGRGYTHYDAMFADGDLTAVSVCTPNASHHPVTIAAAKAGLHVLCEKPVSMDLAQADEMIRACTDAGVVLQVGHHMRSWAAAAKAKSLIDSGAIGDVAFARFRQAHDWGGEGVRGVFGSKAHSGGGTLIDNGCHLFDLARYLCGDVRDVFARTATRKYAIDVEDTAVSTLGFRSGAVGTVEVAWTSAGWDEAFWIYGTEGTLVCDNHVGANVLIHSFRESKGTTWADTDQARYDLQGLPSHTQHVVNFLAAIDGAGPVVCTGDDGREAVRLVLASYASAESGSLVTM